MNNSLLALLALLPALFLASCATTKPTSSSFLANQDELVTDGKIRSFTSPKLANTKLRKAYITPVVLELKKETFSEAKRAELVTYYQDELKTALGEKYEIINAPSSNAYTVRSAITGLNGSNVWANAVLAVVAVPLDNGGASVETEVLKGKSSERLYAEARSIAGGLTGKGSFTSKTFGYLSSTSHSKAALKNVAQTIADKLPTP